MTEFESMIPVLETAKYAGNIVLPFKFHKKDFNWERLNKCYRPMEMTTPDITETTKKVFLNKNNKAPGGCYRLNDSERNALIGSPDSQNIHITPKDANGEERIWSTMSLWGSMLYVFKTGIAFVVLQLMYEDISVPEKVTNLGYAEPSVDFYYKDTSGYHIFDLNQSIKDYAVSLGLKPFFEDSYSLFLEAYICNYAIVPRHFAQLETIKQATFNMHLMKPFDRAYEDDSESDVRYVYAVKNQETNAYRWGCCVTSQTISYITADPDMDITYEIEYETECSIPLVILALYQKYSCLWFTEQLLMENADFAQIKKDMLHFRAYGTIGASVVSRWNNIREIYADLMEVNGIFDSIGEISDKVDVVNSYQREKSEMREKVISWVITIFGIISIEDSILSVVQSLQSGDTALLTSARISSIALGVVLIVALVVNTKKNE